MSASMRKKTVIDSDAGYIRVSHVDVPERDPELRKQAIDDLVVVRTKELREAAGRMGKSIPDEYLYIDMDLSGTSVEKRPVRGRRVARSA